MHAHCNFIVINQFYKKNSCWWFYSYVYF